LTLLDEANRHSITANYHNNAGAQSSKGMSKATNSNPSGGQSATALMLSNLLQNLNYVSGMHGENNKENSI